MKICPEYSPGWERSKDIPGNWVTRKVLLEGGNSSFLHSKLNNSIANLLS